LERKSLYKEIKRPLTRKNWSLNTTKHCSLEENLPKKQQFKNYYFHKRTKKDREKFSKTFIKTDHISMDYSKTPVNKNKKKNMDFKKFNPRMSTREPWMPRPHHIFLGNESSVSYNIITNEKIEKNYSTPLNINKSRINFKRMGLTHYDENEKPYSLHFNNQYKKAYAENPAIFRIYNGIFTNMYDSAFKNGNIYPPFKTKTLRESGNK
jgi:hypothetical protein